MSKSMYFAVAALGTVLAATSGANAGLMANGISPNGISSNGVSPNGVSPNGVSPNGTATSAHSIKAAILQDGFVVVVK